LSSPFRFFPATKIAYEQFDSDLRAVLKSSFLQAKKALKRFPSIGDPAAEKILLFSRSYPVRIRTQAGGEQFSGEGCSNENAPRL
jgi:hypothetical protein